MSTGQTGICDDDCFSFVIYPGKAQKVSQFNAKIGAYANRFFKMNQKRNPSAYQMVDGLQKFYIEYYCNEKASKSREFFEDVFYVFQSLFVHFKISNPHLEMTNEMFTDVNTTEFRFVLFLFSMKPSFTVMIMEIMDNF